MKKLIVKLASVIALLTIPVVGFAEVKLGYLDMQKAIQSTSAGKKAKTELETEFNKRKKELEGKESDLKKMAEDVEKKKAVLSEDAFMKKQQEWQEEAMKVRELFAKNQMEIQKKERELTEPILKKMKTVIEKIAKADSYTMIFEKNEQSVLWAKSELDVTDKAIKEFEAMK